MIQKNEDELKIDALTKREMEVLKEMAVGKFNRDIAKEMKISERTVKNHISSIFKKLEVTDRTQLRYLQFVTTLFRLCNILFIFYWNFVRGMFHVKHSSFNI